MTINNDAARYITPPANRPGIGRHLSQTLASALAVFAVAAVWLYQGLWCKLILARADHLQVVTSVLPVNEHTGRIILMTIGASEVLIAAGVIACAFTQRLNIAMAILQTVVLLAMNTAGLIWAGGVIQEPSAMVINNLVFCALVWTLALQRQVTK